MYSLYQRANTVFAFALSVAFAVAAVVALVTPFYLTKFTQSQLDALSLDVLSTKLQYGKYDPFFQMSKKQEYGFINMKINADLSPLFHWNTKQIYVSVVMDYSSPNYNQSELIIWDDILFSKEESVFDGYKIENKYPITEIDTTGLKNKEVLLQLKWEVVPYFGWFDRFESKKFPTKFPGKYNP